MVDIKGLNSRETTGARQGETGAVRTDPRARNTAQAGDVARDDTVELSSLAEFIRTTASKLASQPAVDENRVRDIRNAIASGEYQIDSTRVAQKLIEADNL
ncbi:MAG: flagellar biosynthesis anti-sigma factor FlgM [Pseudomonadales bacterium]|nr:flagellar biosynthesis anti-sigma factor FlgM [Pseudomonadales bacterium]